MKKETKSERITIRCTPTHLKVLVDQASMLNMPLAAYASDKLFNGKQRNQYARRKICKTLVKSSSYLDEVYDILSSTDSEYIEKALLLPPLENARKELNSIWRVH